MINYSRTLVFYNIYLSIMLPYAIVSANATRLGLTAQQVTDLTGFLAAWNTAYANYISPLTYGRLTTAQINALYKLYKAYCDGIKQQLKNNPALSLSELEYIIFDIHKNVIPRAHIPAPTAEASVTLRAANHLNNEYRASDIANPTKGGKPTDVKKVIVFLLVLPADKPAPTHADLNEEMESGSMIFDIPFTENLIGEIAYVAVCFANDSGRGNMSAIIASPII